MTETSVCWEIEARGDVQKVGYRDFVEAIGRRLGLAGMVRNDEKDSRLVLIVAQGSSERLEQFVRLISGEHGIIHAESVTRVRDGPATPSLPPFTQVRGEDLKEIAESGEAAVKLLSRMWDSMRTGNDELRETVREGNASLGSKVDTVGSKVDTLGSKMDRVGSKVDSVGSKVVAVGSKVDEVAKAVRAEGRQNSEFRHELAQAVAHLDAKYGAISKTLGRIEKALEQQTRAQIRASERQTEAILKLASQVARANTRVGKRRTSGPP